ncbi:ead/Ea22-like family protein [Zhihengliuella sp.]|uniref:ead/Ea22-like family protein n=1 Tax=Zhihengliuella sp. TaxID=1954483 RepID=UPI002811D301|nr:ead/Ea22-like family protein [Zhihengliuella sp.]
MSEDLDLDALRKIAVAAPQSDWEAYSVPGRNRNAAGYSAVEVGDHEVRVTAPEGCFRIVAHMAAFDPPTVLAILDRLATAERDRDASEEKAGHFMGCANAAEREERRLRLAHQEAYARANTAEANVLRLEELATDIEQARSDSGLSIRVAEELRHRLKEDH